MSFKFLYFSHLRRYDSLIQQRMAFVQFNIVMKMTKVPVTVIQFF